LQDVYGLSHETREDQSYRTPDALWRPYLLLLCIIILPHHLLLLIVLLFVHNNSTGISVPAVFLWPSIVIVSLHITFSFRWFVPETIDHDTIDSIIDLVVSGTGDANQVRGPPYALDPNYQMFGLVPTEIFVGDSMQHIGRQTNSLGFKLELAQKNNTSLR